MTEERSRLPAKFGSTLETVPVVDFLPDQHCVEIHIPASPERGRLRLSIDKYRRFLERQVGFYHSTTDEEMPGSKTRHVTLNDYDGPESGRLVLTVEEMSCLVMNATLPTGGTSD